MTDQLTDPAAGMVRSVRLDRGSAAERKAA